MKTIQFLAPLAITSSLLLSSCGDMTATDFVNAVGGVADTYQKVKTYDDAQDQRVMDGYYREQERRRTQRNIQPVLPDSTLEVLAPDQPRFYAGGY